MQKPFDPKKRYQSAREFGDKLAAVLLAENRTELNERVVDNSERQDVEIAHVLFMDIVGYSKLLIDQQKAHLQKLQEIVLATNECGAISFHISADAALLPTTFRTVPSTGVPAIIH